MSKERKSINTTLDATLYNKIQQLSINLSFSQNKKIYVNDLLEEGMIHILEKYGVPLDNQETDK